MRTLAIDIGTGTQDIVIYDSEKEVENSLIMIMPSPTVIVAEKIREATSAGEGIVLTGDVMGGGPSGRAVKEHIRKGLPAYATKEAALTLNDDLKKVEDMGVTIIDEEDIKQIPAPTREIVMQDIDLEAIETALSQFGLEMPSKFAVAIQDHGMSIERSNRVFRFEHLEKVIREGGSFEQLSYAHESIPPYLTRIKAASRRLEEMEATFMDTGAAAIFGALLDPQAVQPSMVVNIGNGHTLAAIVADYRITGVFEHHTSRMEPEKLQDYLIRLAEGTLTFEEVFEDSGHGCYIKETVGLENIRSVMVTGPKRGIIEQTKAEEKNPALWSKLHFAAPFGNMMLSGSFGLLTPQLVKQ